MGQIRLANMLTVEVIEDLVDDTRCEGPGEYLFRVTISVQYSNIVCDVQAPTAATITSQSSRPILIFVRTRDRKRKMTTVKDRHMNATAIVLSCGP